MNRFRLVIKLKDGTVERQEFNEINEMVYEAKKQMFRIDLKKQREEEKKVGKDLDEKAFRLVEWVTMDDLTKLYTYEDVNIFASSIRFFKNFLFNI